MKILFDQGVPARSGMVHAMVTSIDKAGRIAIPKAVRAAARLEPGAAVEIRVVSGRVEIEPVPLEVSLEQRDPLVVAVPHQQQPILKQSMVEDTMAEVRGTGTAKESS